MATRQKERSHRGINRCHFLQRISLLASLIAAFSAQAWAQDSHGTVTEVSSDRVVVRLVAGLQVSEGTTGTVFVTEIVGGSSVRLNAANIRVEKVEDRIVRCTIESQSSTISPRVGAGVEFASAGRMVEVSLTVRSQTPGSRVLLDGQDAGKPPVTRNLPAGRTVHVQVAAEGYVPREETVQLVANQPRELSFNLIRKSQEGTLSVDASVRGATVAIDGVRWCCAPLDFPLQPGFYAVRVEANGFEPRERRIEIRAGTRSDEYFSLNQIGREGTLRVLSDPPDAQVRIDGQPVGATPWSGALPSGTHKVDISRPGYESAEQIAAIEGGATSVLTFQLRETPKVGTLRVRSTPEGADVYIDGIRVGRTFFESTTLSPGSHTVRIAMNGFDSVEEQVQIGAGRVAAVNRTLTQSLRVAVDQEIGSPAANVTVRRSGDKLAIDYDLVGAGKKYVVRLLVSTDGGRVYQEPGGTIEGEFGKDIVPGPRKKIEWKAMEDYPQGLSGFGNRLRIEAVWQPPAKTAFPVKVVLPGVGMIRAGRRGLGGMVLTAFLASAGASGTFHVLTELRAADVNAAEQSFRQAQRAFNEEWAANYFTINAPEGVPSYPAVQQTYEGWKQTYDDYRLFSEYRTLSLYALGGVYALNTVAGFLGANRAKRPPRLVVSGRYDIQPGAAMITGSIRLNP